MFEPEGLNFLASMYVTRFLMQCNRNARITKGVLQGETCDAIMPTTGE